MLEPLKTAQLVDRIRDAARQSGASGGRVTAESIAQGELPPVPEPLPPPALPVRDAGEAVKANLPDALDEVASMLPRALAKITVDPKTPGLLRPLRRNQGGYNHILLAALERLVEVNRQLQKQNQELHGRIVAMQGWMNIAVRTSGLEQDWKLAVENRLRPLSAQKVAQWEERLARLEGMAGIGTPSQGAGSSPQVS